MNVDCFLDTNVIAYAFSNLSAEAATRARAEEVMRGHRYGISAQVLQELFWVLSVKAKDRMRAEDAATIVDNFSGTPCAAVEPTLVKAAIQTSIRYQISYWDAAIIAAAERLGAPRVFSEDLNDGQRYGSVTVVNPFKDLRAAG